MPHLNSSLTDLGHFDALELSYLWAEQAEYRRGEVICPPGLSMRRLFLVGQGFIEACILAEDGRATPVGIVPQGDLFGAEHLLGKGNPGCSARALTSCRLYVFPPEGVDKALRSEGDISRRMVRSLARRLRQAQRFTVIRSNPRIHQRLASLLIMLAQEFGETRVDGGVLIPIPLTHEEVARLISVTRSTATRHLDSIQETGLVRSTRKRFFLPFPDRLAGETAVFP